MRTTRLAFVSVAAMALSAGAAYSITPDGGFQRAAYADNPLQPLGLLEPDADWFRPRADGADVAADSAPAQVQAAGSVAVPELPAPVSEPIAFAPPNPPEPVSTAIVRANPKPPWGGSRPKKSSKLSFEVDAPKPDMFAAAPQAPPPAPIKMAKPVSALPPQTSFPQQMAFPQQQQQAFSAPTSSARPASTSFRK